jgi:hypothetical protein
VDELKFKRALITLYDIDLRCRAKAANRTTLKASPFPAEPARGVQGRRVLTGSATLIQQLCQSVQSRAARTGTRSTRPETRMSGCECVTAFDRFMKLNGRLQTAFRTRVSKGIICPSLRWFGNCRTGDQLWRTQALKRPEAQGVKAVTAL